MDDAPIGSAALRGLSPAQEAYALHCLRSWHGWAIGQMAFIMPTQEWCDWIEAECRRAARKARQNVPR